MNSGIIRHFYNFMFPKFHSVYTAFYKKKTKSDSKNTNIFLKIQNINL